MHQLLDRWFFGCTDFFALVCKRCCSFKSVSCKSLAVSSMSTDPTALQMDEEQCNIKVLYVVILERKASRIT
jgi:hypothetical protein